MLATNPPSSPNSSFLTRNLGALSPEVVAEKRLYQDHYVISPAVTIDVKQEEYKRLCQKTYQVGRIVLINNFTHIEINCSDERLKGDAGRTVMVEKAAAFQISDIMHAGYDYGMVCLRLLTGVPPETVAILEECLLPIHIDQPSLKQSTDHLKAARADIQSLPLSADIISLAYKLQAFLLEAYEVARRRIEKSLRDSLIEIARGRAGKGGRNDLDDFDRASCHALDKVPQDELELMVKKEQSGLASKQDNLTLADPNENAPRRICLWCAESILEAAYMCKHCHKTKDDAIPASRVVEAKAEPLPTLEAKPVPSSTLLEDIKKGRK